MANNANKSAQKVNPVLLVILGIALVAAALNFILFKPGATPPRSTPAQSSAVTELPGNNTVQPTANGNRSAKADNNAAEVAKGETGPIFLQQDALNRNPFLTPAIYLTRAQTQPEAAPSGHQDIKAIPTGPSDVKAENKPDESGMELRLGGVFQKANDKVALIYFKGKGYILRENNLLKGSGYRLQTITPTSVTLVDDNGEEKTLKLAENAVKVKGGGQ